MFICSRTQTIFTEVSRSLGAGFFADSVVLALARMQKYNKIELRDKETIEHAAEFFLG